jgi:hypothetical protein
MGTVGASIARRLLCKQNGTAALHGGQHNCSRPCFEHTWSQEEFSNHEVIFKVEEAGATGSDAHDMRGKGARL